MMQIRRFIVDGESMLPTLRPGDFVVGIRPLRISIGDVVAFEHPTRSAFWLIKRVVAGPGILDLDGGSIDGATYEDRFRDDLIETGRHLIEQGSWFVLSDNRSATRMDSRTLGPLDGDGFYRIALTYWPRLSRL